ncbi:hypothetical protein ACFO4P_13550 [Epilithonimonas pallida]|uniref:EF-hand domain-containing protein n=1 Tax=Epilithonimonas pallida TaxID=373671 RepID=A0ABY1QWT0_9FLAO|nr:hypothetical protein [Epilithonimonas pallida]SMP85879.1 hypothetical protein SAMN05421679_10130 [Epilithonimonas pallida]
MYCTIIDEKIGNIFSYGLIESNKKIKVIAGHLFYGKRIEVEMYTDNFYIPKKLNYKKMSIKLDVDKDGLIDLDKLTEDKYVSKPFKRIYEIEGYWFFIPKQITGIVEYLYNNNLIDGSKIKVTEKHTAVSSRAPIINVNYDKLLKLLIEKKSSVRAHYYCEQKKDFDKGLYADFYVLGNLKNNEIQFELWQITGNSRELFYSHFIQDINSDTFKHFDLATHIIEESSNVVSLLFDKQKLPLSDKIKWFRNDNNFKKDDVLNITKLFFPFDILVDEFTERKI